MWFKLPNTWTMCLLCNLVQYPKHFNNRIMELKNARWKQNVQIKLETIDGAHPVPDRQFAITLLGRRTSQYAFALPVRQEHRLVCAIPIQWKVQNTRKWWENPLICRSGSSYLSISMQPDEFVGEESAPWRWQRGEGLGGWQDGNTHSGAGGAALARGEMGGTPGRAAASSGKGGQARAKFMSLWAQIS